MTDDTTRDTTGVSNDDASDGGTAGAGAGDAVTGVSRRAVLAGLATAGSLAVGTGTAAADPTGQVGTADRPLEALHTSELNGSVTDAGGGPRAVTSLAGEALSVDAGTLAATDARLDVTDGERAVENVESISLGAGLTLADDGDGTARVER
ncbi:hypothetical protein [Halosimplex halobium]|uniref:hypothetical protein n=1 Tax=Halosimplex halobium TaxID=3396618 RepID=UPI003F55BF98